MDKLNSNGLTDASAKGVKVTAGSWSLVTVKLIVLELPAVPVAPEALKGVPFKVYFPTGGVQA